MARDTDLLSDLNTFATKLGSYNLPTNDPKHIPQAAYLGWYSEAVRAQCDPVDGTTDGIVADPEACTIDYTKFRCGNPGVPSNACFTDPQIQTAKNIYSDYRDNATGAFLNYGLSKSSEMQWSVLLGGDSPSDFGIVDSNMGMRSERHLTLNGRRWF